MSARNGTATAIDADSAERAERTRIVGTVDWAPARWDVLISDARERARRFAYDHLETGHTVAADVAQLADLVALDVVEYVLLEVKERVGGVNWNLVFGEDCDRAQQRLSDELERAALVRWPDVSSTDMRFRVAMRRRARSIAFSWVTRVAMAAAGPEDAFSTTFGPAEAAVAGLGDANAGDVFDAHLLAAQADALEIRELFS